MALLGASYDIELATPDGTKPHMDKASDSPSHFGGDTAAYARARAFWMDDPAMNQIQPLGAVIDKGLDGYAGVFVPGGQAPVVDLMQDPQMGDFVISTIVRNRRHCSAMVRLRSSRRCRVRANFARP
jgi:putative intracellular protease/amidase